LRIYNEHTNRIVTEIKIFDALGTSRNEKQQASTPMQARNQLISQRMIKQLYRFLHPRFEKLFLEYKMDFRPRYGHGKPPHRLLHELIEKHRPVYRELLEKALGHRESLWQIREASNETNPLLPSWNNQFLPGLDIVSIYTMMAEFRPRHYIEIGSGNSTKVAYKAKTEQGLSTILTSIDPRPRAEIDSLADVVIRRPLEEVDLAALPELEEHDILFIDNSHYILPNSDCTVFFMELLPRLKKGVIVHVHDVYLPYDYPQFMCDRYYSEQYGLAAFLLANPDRYQPLLPNYFISEDAELSAILAPFWEHPVAAKAERHGGSFWLRIGA
jgi:hypothetical protein